MHTGKIKEYVLLRKIVLLTAENAKSAEVVKIKQKKLYAFFLTNITNLSLVI